MKQPKMVAGHLAGSAFVGEEISLNHIGYLYTIYVYSIYIY